MNRQLKAEIDARHASTTKNFIRAGAWSSRPRTIVSSSDAARQNSSETSTMMRLTAFLFLLACVAAFCPSPHRGRPLTSLNDIGEWRDLVFDYPGTGDDRRLGMEEGAPPKEICILPFPYQEVLLQGETKQLRLYEERYEL